MASPSTWPAGPANKLEQDPQGHVAGAAPPDRAGGQDPAFLVIAEIAQLLRDTRDEILRAAGILGSVTIGMALEARFAARVLQPDIFRVFNVSFLAGLLGCLLTALALLTIANQPTVHALNQLRWKTGAPLDPRPHWVTLPPVGADPEQWTWARAHLLVGAARLARERAQRADTWTYFTAAWFLVWTALIAVGG
jgi:hypothetical protein